MRERSYLPPSYDAFRYLRDVRYRNEDNNKMRKFQPSVFDNWGVTNSDIANYDYGFLPVLPRGLRTPELVKEKKQQGGKVKALDLMTYGYALHSLPETDSGISVGLSRNNGNVRNDEKNIFIEGDVIDPRIWNKITMWLKNKFPDDPHFDIVFCRPIGGFSGIGYRDVAPFVFIMRQIYRTLSWDNGVALIQIPHIFVSTSKQIDAVDNDVSSDQIQKVRTSRPYEESYRYEVEFREWYQRMGKTPGIAMQIGMDTIGNGVMSLVKSANAPKRLIGT